MMASIGEIIEAAFPYDEWRNRRQGRTCLKVNLCLMRLVPRVVMLLNTFKRGQL